MLLTTVSLALLAAMLLPALLSDTGVAAISAAPSSPLGQVGPGTWEHQSPLPTGATLNDVDMISPTEGWAVGQYVGNGGVIVHTTDGGLTWDYATTGVDEPNYAVRFLDSNHGWAASNNAVYYTTDGGRTWGEGQGLIGSFYFLEFATVNDGFATTGIDGGYFRTTDGGRNWSLRRLPRDVAGIQFFDANNGVANSEGGVFHTTDRGNTWSFTPGHGGTYFLNHNLGWNVSQDISERTTDGGATWQTGSMPGGAWAYDAMFVDAQNGWASGSGFQILRTTDSGMTWNYSRFPDTYPYLLYDSWAIDFGDATHGIAVGGYSGGALADGGVILTTSDAGANWLPGHNGSAGTTFSIFALDQTHAWAANEYAEVLWTTDAGARWHLSSIIEGGDVYDVEFADPLNGWAVGGLGYVGRSTDGGRNWARQFPDIDDEAVRGVEVINSQTAIIVGGLGGAISERTTDGGATWTSFNAQNGGTLFDVFFVNPTTGWIVGNGGRISKSTDGGQTWAAQTSPVSSQLNRISFADENNGWIGGGFSATLLHTTNGGATWVQQNPGLPSYASVLGVSAISPSIAWISSGGGPFVPQVLRTTDGGATWVEEETGSNPSDVFTSIFFLTPDYGWLGGTASEPRGGILRRVPGIITPSPTRTIGTTTPTFTSTPIPTLPPTNTPASMCTPVPQSVTGSITFGDPLTTESIDWDRVASTCDFPKTCPEPVSGIGVHYDSYTYTNSTGVSRCITVIIDGRLCGHDIEGVFSRAYLGTFNPSSACINYLADPGFYSDKFAEEATYSFNVAAGATFVVVVESISEEVGCDSYTLTVTGLSACPTATPSSTSTITPIVTATNTPNIIITNTPGGTATTSASATSTIVAATSTPCSLQFTDAPLDSTFYSFIHCLACRGIVNGYPCGGPAEPCIPPANDPYFRPGHIVTRGQLAKIVSSSAGFQEPVTAQTFEDVPPGSTFYDFTERLVSREVMSGYPCGGPAEPCVLPANRPYFRPNATATRGQLAKIMSNSANFQEPPTGQTFEDVPPSSTFYDFIQRLAVRNVMLGYPCGGPAEPCLPPGNLPYFRPSNNVTRGQTTKIVANTFFPACQTRQR